MPEDRLIVQRLSCEKLRDRQHMPLNPTFKLVEHGVDDFRNGHPWTGAVHGHRQVWDYLGHYTIFVKYFVHGLWHLCSATQISEALSFDPNLTQDEFIEFNSPFSICIEFFA